MKHGTFEAVEVEVVKRQKEEETHKLAGGWVNKEYLKEEKK